MKRCKRCLAVLLAGLLAVSLLPGAALAEEDAAAGSYQVSAQEVEAESSLDQTNLREPAAEQAVYDENELVTAIVEFEAPAVMDYYQTSTYATPEEGTSAGQAVSEFLASDDAQQTAQQLLDEQQGIIDQIAALTGAGAISTMAADGSGSSDGVVARWSTLVNGMAIQVPYGILEEINQLDGVRRVYVEHVYDRPVEEYGDVGDDAWYSYSYDKVDVQEAWADGYTGQGMLVAVLDTGLDMTWGVAHNEDGEEIRAVTRCHEAFRDNSFKNDPGSEENGWTLRYDYAGMESFLEGTQLNSTTGPDGDKIVWDYNALYKNQKVPYACDYADGDVNVQPASSDHGTHVSGTIAGYAKSAEGEVTFTGVAPDAQLMMMKVFPDQDGGAQESVVINALEDALKLGADVINLSLGSDNGFSEDDTLQNELYSKVEEAGILLMTSAGNSSYSSASNNYGDNPLTDNVDTSMMSSPAIYDSNLSVASLENAIQVNPYLTWTDAEGTLHEVSYADPWTIGMKATFADGEKYPVYLVEGTGTWADYNNVGWYNEYSNPNGKTGFALVMRGDISFADKVNNAQSFTSVDYRTGERKGVLGVLVYDSDPDATELINMSVETTALTSAFISGQDGAAMAEVLRNNGEVEITVPDEDRATASASDGQMSVFSSWGAGPSLELKPEITAPGGNIWSTIIDQTGSSGADYTGSYGMMSGTSMAAPHMSGIAALVRQRVQAMGVEGSAISDVVDQLLVSTAIPQKDTSGVYYSPRQQGAGLVNAYNALTTPAYVTVDGQNVGKLELLDDPEHSGTYEIAFYVHNISESAVTYQVGITLMRPATGTADSAWGSRDTMLHQDVEIKTVDLGTITVDADQTASFNQTVSLSEEEKQELANLFENGVYVEGFVTLTDTAGSAPSLGLPMLAFFGDWTAAPIFDTSSWTDEAQDGENVFNNEVTWGVNLLGSAAINPSSGQIIGYYDLGQNVFDANSTTQQSTYHAENITISPNGDQYLDRVDDYILYQLRDAKVIVIRVTDAETGEVYFSDWNSYITRTLYNSTYGVPVPLSAMYYGLIPIWDGTDQEGNVLPSGTQCTFEIIAYGDGDYGDPVYEESTGLYVTNFDAVASGEITPTFNGHAMDMTGDVISFPVTVDTVAPMLENHAVSIYEEDGRVYMTGTVYDEDGSLASLQVLPYVTRSYKEGYGDPAYSEVGLDRNNPFLTEYFYDAATKSYTFTADVTSYAHTNESYPGENNYYDFAWNGNVLISCGDYGANERTYAVSVDSTGGLVLSQTSALLHPGSSFDLSVIDNTGLEGEIVRTSSNPEVATIDEVGHVEAIAPGQTIITVSKGSATAICVVAVEEYNTEVLDFDLSLVSFDGLKPNGQLLVKVDNLQPADVQLDEIRWEVYEDEDYTEYATGLLDVEQYSSDGLSGSIYMTISATQEGVELPAGTGYLDVTLNGVTRTLDLSWPALYESDAEDDLVSGLAMEDQVIYVNQGESADLIARYRQTAQHTTSSVVTELTDLQLDGPDFYYVGGSYEGTLVNDEGYALPDEVHLYTRYINADGSYSDVEIINSPYYQPYSYDPATGKITVQYAPSGAANQLVIKADGVAAEGNPAGEMSGQTWERPDPLYGPFDWQVTDGTGNLTTSMTEISGQEQEIAVYTPAEPGVSYITATTKDGAYSVNFAVVCEGILPEFLDLDTHRMTLERGESATLTATLTPEPTLEEDAKVTYTSFNPEVATVDENGTVTGVGEGYAYIKVSSAADNRVISYCVVRVNARMNSVQFVDYDGTLLKQVWVADGNSAEAPDDPVREGYTFLGWDNAFTNVTGDLVITAQYEINRYTVSFVADDQVIATVEKEYGQRLTAEDYPAVPQREGYTGAWEQVTSPITGDVTVQAVYTQVPGGGTGDGGNTGSGGDNGNTGNSGNGGNTGSGGSTGSGDQNGSGGSTGNGGTAGTGGSTGTSSSTDAPKTGDQALIVIPAVLIVCAALGLAILMIRRRRQQ